MGKAKKIIIGVVVTALVGTGIGGGLMYVRKEARRKCWWQASVIWQVRDMIPIPH